MLYIIYFTIFQGKIAECPSVSPQETATQELSLLKARELELEGKVKSLKS